MSLCFQPDKNCIGYYSFFLHLWLDSIYRCPMNLKVNPNDALKTCYGFYIRRSHTTKQRIAETKILRFGCHDNQTKETVQRFNKNKCTFREVWQYKTGQLIQTSSFGQLHLFSRGFTFTPFQRDGSFITIKSLSNTNVILNTFHFIYPSVTGKQIQIIQFVRQYFPFYSCSNSYVMQNSTKYLLDLFAELNVHYFFNFTTLQIHDNTFLIKYFSSFYSLVISLMILKSRHLKMF